MLTGNCIHPELLRVVSLLGHGDKILIADGNYPLSSKTGDAEKIWLGLKPDLPTVTDVLSSLQSILRFERAEVMQPDLPDEPSIFAEFHDLLDGMPLEKLGRYAFYGACGEPSLRLAISTGETRTFSNLLLTVGVR